MSRAELEQVLEYVLNKASAPELEVIAQACERRAHDRSAFLAFGMPQADQFARDMAKELEGSLGASRQAIRDTVRGLVAGMLRRSAPELGEEEIEELLGAWVPDPEKAGPRPPSAIPGDLLLAMVRQFVDFSEGRMAPSAQRELWAEMPNWKDDYWARFPPDIKVVVKAYLERRIDGETFEKAVLSLLDL